ncbi:MAG: class I SAM-dependent methyltransferase [Planctomycetota bacterium]
MSSQGPSPGLFFDTINAYQRTQALKTAIEIDLFSAVAAGSRSGAELAATCGVNERGVRILADYLVIAGFLTKSVDHYGLTPDSATFLTRSSPAYLGGTLQFLLTPSLTECFTQLTAAVKRGGTAISDDGTVSHDNPIWVDFARAMGPMMHIPAQRLVGLIGGEKSQPLRVLDIAAGHGLFGISVAQHYPNALVTALDWKNVLQVAQENAERAGVADRYSQLPGSAFDTNWGGPYDVVLITNFFHHFDLATCERIARKAYEALVPGGRAVTLEFIPDEGRVTPVGTAEFALTMLATTGHGDAYTFAEYEHVFSKSGFVRSKFHPLPPTMQQAVISYRGD